MKLHLPELIGRSVFFKRVFRTLLALLIGAGFALPAFAGDQVRVVYHIADGNDQALRALANIRNHLRADPDARIVVVALGDGIKFLLDGSRDRNGLSFSQAVNALAEDGVEFRVCNNTLTAHNIPASSVVAAAKIVPSGVAEVARLQARDRFVYLRP
jgi:intracellular sulfur oxidation DsrE/DsrF family protein